MSLLPGKENSPLSLLGGVMSTTFGTRRVAEAAAEMTRELFDSRSSHSQSVFRVYSSSLFIFPCYLQDSETSPIVGGLL